MTHPGSRSFIAPAAPVAPDAPVAPVAPVARVRVARVRVAFVGAFVGAVVSAFVGSSACELTPANYGRPCDDKHPCNSGYECFQEACVPHDDPLVQNDAGPSDAGVVDAG